MKLKPVSHDLLFRRDETHDPRLGEITRTPDLDSFSKSSWDIAIIGFPDDRGVTLNKGRGGAKEAPNAIRKWFYRLVPPRKDLHIADLGDLTMTNSLENDHSSGSEAISLALSRAKRVIILGGGHDWGFSPIQALLQMGRTGFVNFDAHLDVRASSVPHSGTSFWRALEQGVTGEDAIWFGVQSSAAAAMHKEYVSAKGGRIFYGDDNLYELEGFQKAFETMKSKCGVIDVSLDMDVFEMSASPGVSAPQPMGLPPHVVLDAFTRVVHDEKIKTVGIYELSPPYDTNEMTARLSARFMWEACK